MAYCLEVVHIFKKSIGFGASVTVEQLLITVGMLTSLFVSQAVWKYLHATLFSRWLVCFDGLSGVTMQDSTNGSTDITV
jgi:hypothetical protein